MNPLPAENTSKRGVWLRILAVLFFLTVFLVGIKLLGGSFKMVGKDTAKSLFEGADIVTKINGPVMREDGTDEAELIPPGAIFLAQMRPHENSEVLSRLAERGVTSFSMELMPRTTLAQRMDCLSAFSTVAGYMAVIRGAEAGSKFFPMLTTAAGTIPPAHVFIIGAGVVILLSSLLRRGGRRWG